MLGSELGRAGGNSASGRFHPSGEGGQELIDFRGRARTLPVGRDEYFSAGGGWDDELFVRGQVGLAGDPSLPPGD